ncbi:alpha/beta hydrolase [Halobacteriales archaeon QS_8_69_26]|nr:MAG: alpha/beta hydrolase [Halobacteriales archaeon QS_8_69_26]
MSVELNSVETPSGETIAYREREGSEVPVVLVHGNMSSSKHYDVLIDALDPEYDVYAPDLRGFGASSYEERIDSLHDFADDLVAWVEEAGVPTPFHLVGWSTGGGPAMVLAAEHPEWVRRMALISPVSTRGYPIYEKDEAGQPIPGEHLTTREEIAADPVQVAPVVQAQENEDAETMKAIWNELIYVNGPPDPEKYDEYVEDMFTQRNLVDVDYALVHFNVSGEHNGVEPDTGQASEIEAPTLVLRGEDDLVITEEMVEETMADLGDVGEFVELPDCGHSPLVDDLDRLVTEIEDHFER